MKKIKFSALIIGLLLIPIFVLANGHHEDEIEEGRKLVESKVSCDELTDEQLEAIGEYYMEQMHPGEAHEAMDVMMGGEGSESLRNMHIQMARNMYCGEGGMMGSGGMMGMMPMMMNMMGGNMMGSGMMGNSPIYYRYGYNNFWSILWLIFLIGLIAIIIWAVYRLTRKEKESQTPISILQKRYAKGEINKKQFEEMKKEIGE